MVTLERADTTRRVGWVSLLGLLLIPLLVAGGFVWATWSSQSRLDRVEAAIVNLDEPVTINDQLVPLGRQLAGGLVGGVTGAGEDAEQNFSWLLTDADDAAEGVASGRYAAVVTIPENFSAQATSYSRSKASEIDPAEITVQTSKVTGIADTAIGQAITTAATAALNTELTRQYLDNVYLGFNSTGKQFTTVAKAAGRLADGTTSLTDGIERSADGAAKLADGLGRLDSGADRLADGTAELATGTSTFARGLRKLADGTQALPGQTRKLADGMQGSADGAGQLAEGAAGLSKGTKQLAGGLTQAATGVRDYGSGVSAYTQGVAGLNRGLQQYERSMQGLARDGIACPESVPAEACPVFLAGFRAGAGAAVSGLNTEDPRSGSTLLQGARQLATNGRAVAAGGTELAAGIGRSARGAEQLATGASGLAGGTRTLAAGLDRLADGTDGLADGLKPVVGGIAKSATGAEQLAGGVRGLSTGSRELAGGAGRSANGATQLADGLDQLTAGGNTLADGSTRLADGLRKGAEQVPSYDQVTRTKLAETVATPVTAERPDSLFANVANTTFLAVIALWVGALAAFLVLRAVPAAVLTSMKPAWRLALDALAPAAAIAAVQGLALAAALGLLLRLDGSQLVTTTGLAVLAGLTFVAVNQALVALGGGIGRFVAVAAVVLTAAAGIISAIPPLLAAVTPFLPLTPALEGLRAATTGGSAALGAAGLLAAWLIGAVTLTVIAVARRRMLPAPVAAPA